VQHAAATLGAGPRALSQLRIALNSTIPTLSASIPHAFGFCFLILSTPSHAVDASTFIPRPILLSSVFSFFGFPI